MEVLREVPVGVTHEQGHQNRLAGGTGLSQQRKRGRS